MARFLPEALVGAQLSDIRLVGGCRDRETGQDMEKLKECCCEHELEQVVIQTDVHTHLECEQLVGVWTAV